MPQYLTWEAIEAIERGAFRVLLYGPPGTGKTRSAYNTAESLGKAIYNITLSDETPAAEIRGHYVPKGNVWEFMYGPAVRAAVHEQNGAVLLLDELDKASQDCLDFLHGLLNDPAVAQMTLPSGEILRPNDKFQVIATMNGELEDLPFALQDRFKIAIEVTEPHPDAIASLPEDLQGVARNVEAYDVQKRPATIRAWHAYATLRELPDVGPENAAKAIFGHRHQELMDAITFQGSATNEPIVDEHPDDEYDAPCTCSDCAQRRAYAWFSHNELEINIDEDDESLPYQCAGGCGSWFETEEEAVRCCYDDDEWIDYCRRNGVAYE
jgi:DNA polymerase III delta prime subunit